MSAFNAYRQWKRLYSKQVIMEDAIYKEDEVPEDKKSDAQITVEVIHEMLLVNKGGEIQRLIFKIPEALDKDGNTGGGYELGGSAYVTPDYPSGSGTATKLYVDEVNNLSEDNLTSANQMLLLAGGWPTPTTTP